MGIAFLYFPRQDLTPELSQQWRQASFLTTTLLGNPAFTDLGARLYKDNDHLLSLPAIFSEVLYRVTVGSTERNMLHHMGIKPESLGLAPSL